MIRVTSLTEMPEKQLNRLIRLVGLLFLVLLIAFAAFYIVTRYNPIQQPSLVDRQIAVLEQKVQAEPADIVSRGTLADLYVKASRWQDAVAQYNAIIATGKDEELARLGRAEAYEALGDPASATTDWQRVIEIASPGEMAAQDPRLALAYYRLGMIQLTAGDAQAGVDSLVRSLAITRSDADTLYALGNGYTTLGQLDKAIDSFKRATAFVPIGWPEPYLGLSKAYAAKGDAAMATWATAMADLAEDDPDNADAKLRTLLNGPADLDASMGLGLVAESRGEGQDAVSWYQHVLDADPSNAAAMLAMSRVRPVTPASPAAPSPSQEGQN
jgi:tetratricopeptide (TPR) repeat protein